jgi:hypothetical protein
MVFGLPSVKRACVATADAFYSTHYCAVPSQTGFQTVFIVQYAI